MQNEFYYLNNLEVAMQNFLEEEGNNDNELGWVPDELSRNMAIAAFTVLKHNYHLNEFMKKEGIIL